MLALRRRHDGEAHGIRIGDRSRRQAREPATRLLVISSGREMHDDAWARVDTVERARRRLAAGAEQREPVNFRNDQVRRDEPQTPPYRLAEQAIGFGVVLIPPAAQRDPGAAIDE